MKILAIKKGVCKSSESAPYRTRTCNPIISTDSLNPIELRARSERGEGLLFQVSPTQAIGYMAPDPSSFSDYSCLRSKVNTFLALSVWIAETYKCKFRCFCTFVDSLVLRISETCNCLTRRCFLQRGKKGSNHALHRTPHKHMSFDHKLQIRNTEDSASVSLNVRKI